MQTSKQTSSPSLVLFPSLPLLFLLAITTAQKEVSLLLKSNAVEESKGKEG